MTKMIKMSLIAAVAVTGMTSVATAQPLEDAIKGVDVSGQLRYRYEDKSTDNKGATADSNGQDNEYTMKIATKAKVNDVVTANVQIEAKGVSGANNGDVHATNDAVGDRDVNLAVTKANFEANLGVATVIAGKQSVPSPFLDNASDDSTRGTGAVALIPVAGMTVAAGHFVNFQHSGETDSTNASAPVKTSVYSGSNINALALIGKVADVSFDAWYVTVSGDSSKALATGLNGDIVGTSIGAKAAVAGVNIDARWSKVTRDGLDDSGLTKVVASTKIGAASIVAGIAMTPKDNVNATIDADNDAQSGFKLWQASTEKLNDSTAILVGAGMDVMPNVNVDAKYVTASATKSATEDVDVTELLLGATYKMSKNFTVHARYSMMSTDYSKLTEDVDATKGRLEVKYTF